VLMRTAGIGFRASRLPATRSLAAQSA
jgi:hypothetical protein